MLQFLTTIPVRINLNATDEDFGKGLAFAPVIGLIIGGTLALTYHFIGFIFPSSINSIIIIIEYIFLTGGLHLDGLGDTFDGLFSNRPKERMLEIMKDSRLGTNGVLAIFSVLILLYGFLSQIPYDHIYIVLILFPVAGRTATLIGASISKYARNNGLGKSFVEYCGWKELIIGLISSICIFSVAYRGQGVLLLITSVVASLIFVKVFSRKIDGVTGDILGAVCELNQVAFIACYFVLL
jgi:adenosylcobinamide-GDP ribazoletransferase